MFPRPQTITSQFTMLADSIPCPLFPSTVPMIRSEKQMVTPPLAQLIWIPHQVKLGLCLPWAGRNGQCFQNGGGRGSAFVGKAGGWGGAGTFILGLLTHDGSNNALGTPRWVVQQKGWTGTSSGAVNNKNWTPGSKDVPVILGAMWDGTATTATLNGSTFQNSGAAHTVNNQNRFHDWFGKSILWKFEYIRSACFRYRPDYRRSAEDRRLPGT